MASLIITNISQLVTLSGPPRPRIGEELRRLHIIEDGALIARDGQIVAIGRSRDLEDQLEPDAEQIDAGGGVAMPGFVDAHTHPVFAGTRENEYEMRALGKTYQEIAAEGGGIRATVRRTRAASEDELFNIARNHVDWFLRHGTTTVEAKSGYGLSVEDELKILRVIRRLNRETPLELVPTFLGAHEVPDEFRQDRRGYIKLIIEEMLPRVAQEGLAEYADVFCEQRVFSLEETRAILSAATKYGLKLRLHADQLSSFGGARLASELGAATADHLEHIDAAAIEALKNSGVIPVLLPGAVFNLGASKYPPAREMIEAGLPVVIATDFNPGSSPTPNMQICLSVACTQMRMTPAEAITASTINAAYSIGRGHRLGSLEVGKQADIVIFDCSDYRQIPYFFGVNHVSTVIKRGTIIANSKSEPARLVQNETQSKYGPMSDG